LQRYREWKIRVFGKDSIPLVFDNHKLIQQNDTIYHNLFCVIFSTGADTGGGGTFAPSDRFREGRSSPPEFGIFCSYFQNSFSIACLRERNPRAKQEKYLSQ